MLMVSIFMVPFSLLQTIFVFHLSEGHISFLNVECQGHPGGSVS